MKNVNVRHENWDGEYPAPPGAKVLYTCLNTRGFTDGSPRHYATCSFRADDTWETSLQDKDVRCQKTGKPCLRWDSPRLATTYNSNPSDGFVDAMFYAEHVLNQDLSLHENFCRNPTFKDRPWCFVDDGTIHSEYCQVPLCDDMGKLECKLTQKGGEYVGVKNKSISRFPCLPWLESTHFLKDRIYNDRRPPFPDLLSDTHNYCRNPNAKPGGPWCYIQDSGESGIEWEYCDVPFCALEYPNIACDPRNQCESEKDDVPSIYPECRKTEMGNEYKGIKNRTETGNKCLPWGNPLIKKALENILLSHISAEDRFKEKFQVLDGMGPWTEEEANYCRNPGFRKRPWCFVSNDLKWEYCHIPFCPNRKVNCKVTDHGMEYAGKTNMTVDGKKCQNWLSQTPNKHSMIFSLPYFPDHGVDSRHNYCRNPNRDGSGPWCYTEEDIGRQHCDIPFCWEMYQRSAVKGSVVEGYPECRQTENGKEYIGTMRKTVTGRTCVRWDSILDEVKFNKDTGNTNDFEMKLPSTHQNFCRNPTSLERPWCFLADTNITWEFCDIPLRPNYPSEQTRTHAYFQ
ncbi:unnamed protein product [Darwinula stevensoni]|uniref:Kringle domain-containing protein n=1 Tax=Darwinula stevensoni TaxID=69355 RepID=A0A7R9AEF7_9CRUS|nr:unnamed protein product [Darwinula stevensoni]CAG0901525.1 unnamed protein product [Darwinula stevensoni]